MNFIMNIPGLKDCIVTKVEERSGEVLIYVEMERKSHRCPKCGQKTNRVHDYRWQKIKHLKWFERMTYIWYKRRRYVCTCGKRFSEKNTFVKRYQRTSNEWNQAVAIRSITGKTFKEVGDIYGTSSTTVIRRFDRLAQTEVKQVESLPPVIAMDEYKGDTKEGKYQVIIADGVTKQPLDILPNRKKKTIKRYLQKYGHQVQVVIMDMSPSFKAAVQDALGKPVIVADRFHFSRYIYWALDRVRRRVQNSFHEYDRKKCKRMKHIFYKHSKDLTEQEKWYLERYLSMSKELQEAYKLKELYQEWFTKAKMIGKEQIAKVKQELEAFYQKVEELGILEMMKAIKTLQNWQTEILNSFVYDQSNGFLEGINNTTKVLKRNGYGFRNFKRFRAKILLVHKYKGIGVHIG
ncbi:MAG: ISL3 family transposase [Bacillales bacterium]|nr:ISL3 family transposase [Bacillales bacterium]MBE3569630.1 ISL3 family transposase [Bacillales bacterium]MBE3570310.1 ISL3 family transposase [Bacillales bacterium]